MQKKVYTLFRNHRINTVLTGILLYEMIVDDDDHKEIPEVVYDNIFLYVDEGGIMKNYLRLSMTMCAEMLIAVVSTKNCSQTSITYINAMYFLRI